MKDRSVPRETVLTDSQGAEFTYNSAPLPFRKAMKLGLQLSQLLAPVLGEGAAVMFGGESGGTGDPMDDKLDLSRVPAALERVPMQIMELGDTDLIQRIFADTVRFTPRPSDPDGKPMRMEMGREDALTLAYSGGNWAEFGQAIWWVLQVNYLPFGMEGSGGLEKLSAMLSRLTDGKDRKAHV